MMLAQLYCVFCLDSKQSMSERYNTAMVDYSRCQTGDAFVKLNGKKTPDVPARRPLCAQI